MARLSVNLNKVALLRNSRRTGSPSVVEFGKVALEAGAQGLTVHPRPDERHIRRTDVYDLAELLTPLRPTVEYNIEGYPSREFLGLVEEVKPEQVTLVPDPPGVLTSDSGWEVGSHVSQLREIVARLKSGGMRVILFVDPEPSVVDAVPETGADGIEIYTGHYAAAVRAGDGAAELKRCLDTGARARALDLVTNVGHDLDLVNLPALVQMPGLHELSIGHELTAEALRVGMTEAVRRYRAVIES